SDREAEFYTRPEGKELFIVGSLHGEPEVDPDNYAQSVTDDEMMAYVDVLVRRVPVLAQAELRTGWASLYDMSPDWQPVIGEVEDGIFVDAGTSGHGFKLAPALGRSIADLMTGAAVPGLEEFHHRRFAEHHLLAAGYGGAKIV